MKLSIVATLYQSSTHVHEFYSRASASAKQFAGDDYEIVLVNDGSPDNSLDLAIRLTHEDPHLVVIDLSRNFGHHKAMMTGLLHSRGEFVFLIDSDLEEQPEWLLPFAEQKTRENVDVVYGVQRRRKGSWFDRWSGRTFYSLFNAATGLALEANVVVARLMTRRYVDALLQHTEREIFMAGLWQITGFDQSSQVVEKLNTSQTTYTLTRKFSMLVNSVTSFSNLPLVSIFYVGCVIFFVALGYTGLLVVNWAFFAKPASGWTSVMASVWLLGGLIISFLGVVGIYLSKIYSETKQRPYTIVRNVYAKRPMPNIKQSDESQRLLKST